MVFQSASHFTLAPSLFSIQYRKFFKNSKFNHIIPMLEISQPFPSYLKWNPNSLSYLQIPTWSSPTSSLAPFSTTSVFPHLPFQGSFPCSNKEALSYLLILKSTELQFLCSCWSLCLKCSSPIICMVYSSTLYSHPSSNVRTSGNHP